MSILPKHIKNKIEQYMKYSHRANELREEIDVWIGKQGIDSVDTNDDYWKRQDVRGAIIQDIMVDAAQGTVTRPEAVIDVIDMIERELT